LLDLYEDGDCDDDDDVAGCWCGCRAAISKNIHSGSNCVVLSFANLKNGKLI
jgi:hypothetical protein